MELPEDLLFSSDHEWVRREGSQVTVGITDYAQDALGDIVFVELPTAGVEVVSGQSMSEVESTKSVSEIYAPVAGVITSVNDTLADRPELLNEDPYGEGWICVIELESDASLDGLLDAAGYASFIDGD